MDDSPTSSTFSSDSDELEAIYRKWKEVFPKFELPREFGADLFERNSDTQPEATTSQQPVADANGMIEVPLNDEPIAQEPEPAPVDTVDAKTNKKKKKKRFSKCCIL